MALPATPDEIHRRPLQSVGIAMRLLDAFSTAPELGASEAARQLGIAKSTAHNTLATLAPWGLVEHTTNGRYRLGLRSSSSARSPPTAWSCAGRRCRS
jgi:DNA-binding IclR family transcriptional regulator